eukprot:3939665-Pyramimonas_sp.AAC.1
MACQKRRPWMGQMDLLKSPARWASAVCPGVVRCSGHRPQAGELCSQAPLGGARRLGAPSILPTGPSEQERSPGVGLRRAEVHNGVPGGASAEGPQGHRAPFEDEVHLHLNH